MKRAWDIVSVGLMRLATLALLMAPIVIYVDKFGGHITSDHQRWAEMGSAMSGIYGPILAFLAFGVVILQARMHSESNNHMANQSHIQQADSDIAFYLARLESALDKRTSDGGTVGKHLMALFADAKIDQLREESTTTTAMLINREHSQLFAAWLAFQSIAPGLAVVKEHPYSKSLSSAKQRANVVLSLGMCITLDKYTWCLAQGASNGPFLFSDLPLPQAQ